MTDCCQVRVKLVGPSRIRVQYAGSVGPIGPEGPPGPAGGSVAFATGNKDMPALVTDAPYELACSTPLAGDPANDGYIQVLLNGVAYGLAGDRTSDFYFSIDGGVTARLIADIQAGDLLYVGEGLTFDLEADDVISFLFTSA